MPEAQPQQQRFDTQPQQQRVVISLAPYLDILYRHRFSALCSLAVGLALTLFAVITFPKNYMSSTVLAIEGQQISNTYVAGTTSAAVRDQLRAISQEALSRPRLEPVVLEYDLYRKKRDKRQSMEEIIDYMRKHINLTLIPDDPNASKKPSFLTVTPTAFQIDFSYTDPALAQRVAARLADLFVDENLRQRAAQAAAAAEFLDDQIAKSQARLAQKEAEIRTVKAKFQGSLPQDLDTNMKALDNLQNQLRTSNENMVALDQKIQALDNDKTGASLFTINGQKGVPNPAAELAAMENQLTILRAQYSEDYPDVVQLKAQIASLRDELKNPKKDNGYSPIEEQIKEQRADLVAQLNALKTHANDQQRAITELQNRIAATPDHEQQLSGLLRDFNIMSAEYHQLVDKKMAAQLTENLEERQEGQRFRVSDPASLPTSPEMPSPTILLIIGIAVSVLLALLVPFLIFFTDSSLKEPDDIREAFDLPVAATIPTMEEIEGLDAWRATVIRGVLISGAFFVVGASGLFVAAHALF